MRIAVLASHEGSLLQVVLDACADGRIPASVVLVISNNSSSGVLRRAAAAGIAAEHLSSANVSQGIELRADAAELDAVICDRLDRARVDLVLLAGYMKPLGIATLARFAGRILNTHPALLPKFGGRGFFGRRVHEAVLAAGESESGATLHWVAGDYDTGPIIAQTRVPVLSDDTPAQLEARVKTAERALLIDTLQALSLCTRFQTL